MHPLFFIKKISKNRLCLRLFIYLCQHITYPPKKKRMKKKRIENLIVTLIAVFISLPTYADDNANTSNVYKLVTNVSELTDDGTLFIIANKEKGKALCKDFYKLNRGVNNLEEMQPYGDFFIINEKIATFKLDIIRVC